MTKARTAIIIVALLGGAGAACNRTPADEQQTAVEAQQEANRDIQAANREAAEKTAEVRQDVNEKTAEIRKDMNEAVAEGDRKEQAEIRKDYDKAVAEGNEKVREAQVDARQKAAEAQAEANETIREANRGIVASDDKLRDWGQEKIDSLNNKIDGARVKAEKASPQVKAEVEAGLRDVQAKRDAIVTEFAGLDTRSEQAVNRFKNRVDNEIDKLKERVDRLERRM